MTEKFFFSFLYNSLKLHLYLSYAAYTLTINIIFFCLFRITPKVGSSLARGQASYSCHPKPQPQQHRIQAASVTYTTAHGNTTERGQGSNCVLMDTSRVYYH